MRISVNPPSSEHKAARTVGLCVQLQNNTDKPVDYKELKEGAIDEMERKKGEEILWPLLIEMPCGHEHVFNSRKDIPNESIPCPCGDSRHLVFEYLEK